MFVRKVDGSLLLCNDYRGINEDARKDAYLLPRVDDTIDEMKDASFYTCLDLALGFWQVRVRDEDVNKTVLHTPNRLMAWIGMPLGMGNVVATFQRMMNNILRYVLDKIVTMYLNDVCM
jgi:hypothetical protein